MSAPPHREPGDSRATSDPEWAAGAAHDLAARFWDRIRLFALRRVSDPATAEDIAQEAIRLVNEALRAGRVENPESLPGYAFRTAHHLCLQRYRSTGREAQALGRLSGEPEPDQSKHDPLVALIGEERRRSVRRAVDELTPADRELVTLLYFDEIDTAVAATRLGVTPEALRVRKHRALKRLGALLGDQREDVTT